MLKKLNWIFSPQLLPVLRNVSGIVTLGKIEISIRVVKRSSDLRTSNFKFEFVFVFQPFDIRIQASLIRRRQFCLESGGCYFSGLPAVNSSNARRAFAYPFLPSPPCITPRRSITLCLAPLASYQSDKSWWPRHRADINGWQ